MTIIQIINASLHIYVVFLKIFLVLIFMWCCDSAEINEVILIILLYQS